MRRALLLAMVVGCGGGEKELTVEELVKRDGPSIEPMLVRLEKIAGAPLPEPTGTIKLLGPPLRVSSYVDDPQRAGNAAMAFDADFKDLGAYGNIDLRTSDYSVVNDCYLVVRKGLQASRPNGETAHKPWANVAESWLKRCKMLRYLVVMKMVELETTKYIDKENFGGGHAAANVLVFDLSDGSYAGGVTAVAESSSRTTDPDGDLRDKFYNAVRSAVRKQLPDASF